MYRTFFVAALTLIAAMMLPRPAAADFWARLDHPWTNWELDQAIRFCRQQPRLGTNTRMFVDQLMGRQIQTCMYSLGWIGVSR
jgi:hypothetical protein